MFAIFRILDGVSVREWLAGFHDKWCKDNIYSSSPVHAPLPSLPLLNSCRAWQDLSPTPCRCYRLEYFRNAKWDDWSLLDLWLQDPPHQRNSSPHNHLPTSSFLSLLPSSSIPHSMITPLPALSYHFLPLAASTSQEIHYQLICGCDLRVVSHSSSPNLSLLSFFLLVFLKILWNYEPNYVESNLRTRTSSLGGKETPLIHTSLPYMSCL